MKRTGNRRAFSLIEILVALAILTLGLYGILDLYKSSHRTGRMAADRMQMNSLAHLKLEEFRAAGSQVKTLAAGGSETAYPSDAAQVFTQAAQYKWRAFFRKSDAAQAPVSVRIEVSKTAGKKPPYEVTGLIVAPESGGGEAAQ